MSHLKGCETTSPVRYYSIFTQAGVLWEEPELAVDSKGHGAVGTLSVSATSVQSHSCSLA